MIQYNADAPPSTLPERIAQWREQAAQCRADIEAGRTLSPYPIEGAQYLQGREFAFDRCADEAELYLNGAEALAPSPDDAAIREELRMGHVRIDECSGTAHTNDQPLYDRITFVLQRAEERRAEEEHLRKAVGAEADVLRARAIAAEHRQAAAEYRAQRIVLDQELLTRAEKAEAELTSIGAEALAPPAPDWQPIATAPKELDDVIALGAYDKYGSWLVEASSWCEDPSDGEPCWLAWDYNMPPTHWTRLPAPPRADARDRKDT